MRLHCPIKKKKKKKYLGAAGSPSVLLLCLVCPVPVDGQRQGRMASGQEGDEGQGLRDAESVRN